MALVIGSVCGAEQYQLAVRSFASTLLSGSSSASTPLYVAAMLFSNQVTQQLTTLDKVSHSSLESLVAHTLLMSTNYVSTRMRCRRGGQRYALCCAIKAVTGKICSPCWARSYYRRERFALHLQDIISLLKSSFDSSDTIGCMCCSFRIPMQ